ncbi:MAG: hypothetical protein M3Q46_07835 [Verrucomicrobiota bacterium]|nr:hypothetical protein [Verrucomicrobiota bacterium]
MSPSEIRQLRAFKSPIGIQRFLDEIPYHLAPTAWSPRMVLRERTAHCLEGATFAAAALRALGYPPLVLDLEAEQDTDHVIAVFKVRGCWGAIAKSNFNGCRYREPVYRTLRELALSYFHIYFNLRGQRTLRRYSRPVNLSQFDDYHWMTSDEDVWVVPNHLCDIPHRPLLTPEQTRNLTRVDPRTVQGEIVGHRHKKGGPLPKLFRKR